MNLRAIRILNTVATVLLVGGLLLMFGGIGVAAVLGSELLFTVSMTAGFTAAAICLLLAFAIDRVKCPKCGKPFNRPEIRNWLLRNVAKTQPRLTCAHCGYGSDRVSCALK